LNATPNETTTIRSKHGSPAVTHLGDNGTASSRAAEQLQLVDTHHPGATLEFSFTLIFFGLI
jgi:hypothetical protein